jgi:hypothetical protein
MNELTISADFKYLGNGNGFAGRQPSSSNLAMTTEKSRTRIKTGRCGRGPPFRRIFEGWARDAKHQNYVSLHSVLEQGPFRILHLVGVKH